MCGRGSSSNEGDSRKTPERTTRATTTTTTTTAPTTTVVTTKKPTTQPITTPTPSQKNTKTTFHSNAYVDAFTDPPSKTTSSSSNGKATVSSVRDGSTIEFGLIGAVIGGLLLLLVIALLVFFIYRQRRSKTLKNGSRRQDTIDSNVNGEPGLTAEMTSLPNYDEEQHADENVKPLYTQVNKKGNAGPQNTLETHSQNRNKGLKATTAIEISMDNEKSKGPEDSEEMVDNLLYEIDSVPQSVVYESSHEAEIPQTYGNRLGNTESGTTINKVQSRVTYENVETTTESSTYENQTDRQPESDWGSAYDKLDRLDHVIGNEKVIGENVYDM